MDGMVRVRASSAFAHAGDIVVAGDELSMSPHDAALVVARGKAVVVDPAEGAGGVDGNDAAADTALPGAEVPVLTEVVDPDKDETQAEAPSGRGRRKRG